MKITEQDARAALREQGIRNPSKQLVDNYMRVQRDQEWALEVPSADTTSTQPDEPSPVEAKQAHPSSESNLEPLLRERGELDRPAGPRRAGRPKIIAAWFPAVARAMSDGTPLREALARCGVHGLSPREIRALYRNRALRGMREEARQKWLREWGVRYRRPTARPKGCRGGDCLGMDSKFLREL